MATAICGRTHPGTPPLENGDRLTRAEFEKRWQAMPQLTKAELIDGTVYMPSALRYRAHSRPHALLLGWLHTFSAATPGTEVSDNPGVRLDEDNEPQPGTVLRLSEHIGRQSRVGENDYLCGAPELIGEISGSSAAYYLHQKLHVYRRHGVREYLVWRVFDNEFDWFRLEEGYFVPRAADADGLLKSDVFPGRWLDAAAMLRDGVPAVHAAASDASIAQPGFPGMSEDLQKKGTSCQFTIGHVLPLGSFMTCINGG